MSFDELPFCIELGDAEREQVGFFGFGGGVGDTTCWFLNTTATQLLPLVTVTFPLAGVTDRSFHVLPADISVT